MARVYFVHLEAVGIRSAGNHVTRALHTLATAP